MEKERRNHRPQRSSGSDSPTTDLSSSGNGQGDLEGTAELSPPAGGPTSTSAVEESTFSTSTPASAPRRGPSRRTGATEQPRHSVMNSSAIEEARRRMQKVSESVAEAEAVAPAPLHDTFLDERNDVMSVINELEEQLDRHQDVRERLERELKDANDAVQVAGQRTQELEWQLVTLQTRVEALEQLRQEVALLEEELASANAQLQSANDEQGRTEKERARLRNELKTANKQLEELWAVRKERDGLRSDLGTLTARIDELERSQRDLVDERAALAARLKETAVALEEARGERHQHQILLRTAEDRARELTRVQEELADKLEAVRADKKALQVQVGQLERENVRLVEQRQFYETELSSMRNASRSAELALSSVKKAFAEVRVALTETKTRARRRMIDTWPRIGMPLRGMTETLSDDSADEIASSVGHTIGTDQSEVTQSAGEV
jgi:DNA repair exonuclease SbcCD ATPase subunit